MNRPGGFATQLLEDDRAEERGERRFWLCPATKGSDPFNDPRQDRVAASQVGNRTIRVDSRAGCQRRPLPPSIGITLPVW